MGRKHSLQKSIIILISLLLFHSLTVCYAAEGLVKLSGTSEGTGIESSVSTTLDVGIVGTLTFDAGFELGFLDLLVADRTKSTFYGGFRFDTLSAVSLVFGDLKGIPALRLIIEPHLFPYRGSIKSLEAQPEILRIPLVREASGVFTAGITTRVPLGMSGTLFPFWFTPLVQSGNLHGGGVEAILHTPVGCITLGGCMAGRFLPSEPADELFYGGYPSRWGSYLQFSLSMLPQKFRLPIVGRGECEFRFQIFGMHDGSLGEGMSYSSCIWFEIEAFKVVWDLQRIPMVFGTPGSVIPKVDTSILKENQLSLISTVKNLSVSWIFQERIWRPSPYASDYQKRTVSTHAALDFIQKETVFGGDLRSEVIWMVTGIRKRNVSVTLRLESRMSEVRIVLKPTCVFSTDVVPDIQLDCTIERLSPAGIAWEVNLGFRADTVRMVLSAEYEWEDKQVKITCDDLRRVSLSLAIDR